MPHVTTLLRACRDADEELLLTVLQEIAINGISKAALNEVDCSGRVCPFKPNSYSLLHNNICLNYHIDGTILHLLDKSHTHAGRTLTDSWNRY